MFHSPLLGALGYNFDIKVIGPHFPQELQTRFLIANTCAYIPAIGLIIALAKLCLTTLLAIITKGEDRKYYLGHMARSFFELTSCGILLLPLDIIITIGRKYSDPAPVLAC